MRFILIFLFSCLIAFNSTAQDRVTLGNTAKPGVMTLSPEFIKSGSNWVMAGNFFVTNSGTSITADTINARYVNVQYITNYQLFSTNLFVDSNAIFGANLSITNTEGIVSIGTNDTTKARLYVHGVGSALTNLPNFRISSSDQQNTDILQIIGANGNLNLTNLIMNSGGNLSIYGLTTITNSPVASLDTAPVILRQMNETNSAAFALLTNSAVILNNNLTVLGVSDQHGLITAGGGLSVTNGLTTLQILNLSGQQATNAASGTADNHLATIGQLNSTNLTNIATLTNNAVVLNGSLVVVGEATITNSPMASVGTALVNLNQMLSSNASYIATLTNNAVKLNSSLDVVNTIIAGSYIRGDKFWVLPSGTVLCSGNTNLDSRATVFSIESDANRLSEIRASAISIGISNDLSTVKATIDPNGNAILQQLTLGANLSATNSSSTNYIAGLLTHGDSIIFTNLASTICIGSNLVGAVTGNAKVVIYGNNNAMTNYCLNYICGSSGRNAPAWGVSAQGPNITNVYVGMMGNFYHGGLDYVSTNLVFANPTVIGQELTNLVYVAGLPQGAPVTLSYPSDCPPGSTWKAVPINLNTAAVVRCCICVYTNAPASTNNWKIVPL